MKGGLNMLIAGGIAAALLPALAIGLSLPFIVAGAIAALAFAGLMLLLAPRDRFAGKVLQGFSAARLDLVRELLETAEPHAARLDAAARAIPEKALAARFSHLAEAARAIFLRLEAEPGRLDAVQRFLTYYLPAAANVAEGAAALFEQARPDAERLTEVRQAADRLDAAFATYADNLVLADLSRLDLDLKLLGQALDDEHQQALPKGGAAAPASTITRTRR